MKKLARSIDRLVSRDDVWITKERVLEFLQTGKWKEESFVYFLENHAKQNPNAQAIVDEDGTVLTYRELDEKTTQFALALLEMGIQSGDRIAIQLPNTSHFLISLLGAAKANVLPVLCHMPYTEYDLEYIFELMPELLVRLKF
ncbi:AMP-binding protein [Kyrpidia tusciae]|uniref:AMP-binding protein n=1 Tax=Kyrpidia tusciae TaxID=33943 RepID=UPI0002F89BE3|nr:class I adenylate-forming enzyme family protein [Kyrpidia tusciae]